MKMLPKSEQEKRIYAGDPVCWKEDGTVGKVDSDTETARVQIFPKYDRPHREAPYPYAEVPVNDLIIGFAKENIEAGEWLLWYDPISGFITDINPKIHPAPGIQKRFIDFSLRRFM
jgi:hypothetical protein